jgi:hypothetical protein
MDLPFGRCFSKDRFVSSGEAVVRLGRFRNRGKKGQIIFEIHLWRNRVRLERGIAQVRLQPLGGTSHLLPIYVLYCR